jgi:hypothetical protein
MTATLERRKEVLQLAQEHDFLILEGAHTRGSHSTSLGVFDHRPFSLLPAQALVLCELHGKPHHAIIRVRLNLDRRYPRLLCFRIPTGAASTSSFLTAITAWSRFHWSGICANASYSSQMTLISICTTARRHGTLRTSLWSRQI